MTPPETARADTAAATAATASTRDAILDAAERTFASRGFTATTIKHLAAEAGVNTALLYYYFADKETLYREMLRRLVTRFAAQLSQQMQGAASPEEALRRFSAMQAEVLIDVPHLPTLLVRELVDFHAEHAEEQIAHLATTAFKTLCEVIERGQREGRFRGDVDARFAAISVVTQVAYMGIARPAVGMLLGRGPGGVTPELMRDFATHAADFTLAALAAPTPSPRATRKPKKPRGRR